MLLALSDTWECSSFPAGPYRLRGESKEKFKQDILVQLVCLYTSFDNHQSVRERHCPEAMQQVKP
jgi:hypothetical protein